MELLSRFLHFFSDFDHDRPTRRAKRGAIILGRRLRPTDPPRLKPGSWDSDPTFNFASPDARERESISQKHPRHRWSLCAFTRHQPRHRGHIILYQRLRCTPHSHCNPCSMIHACDDVDGLNSELRTQDSELKTQIQVQVSL